MRNCRCRNILFVFVVAANEANDVAVLAKPTMPSDFEEVRSSTGIRHENPSQEIAGVRSDVLRERQWCRNDVFVQEVNVVAFRVRRVVIER